jgi:hypothetical protein
VADELTSTGRSGRRCAGGGGASGHARRGILGERFLVNEVRLAPWPRVGRTARRRPRRRTMEPDQPPPRRQRPTGGAGRASRPRSPALPMTSGAASTRRRPPNDWDFRRCPRPSPSLTSSGSSCAVLTDFAALSPLGVTDRPAASYGQRGCPCSRPPILWTVARRCWSSLLCSRCLSSCAPSRALSQPGPIACPGEGGLRCDRVPEGPPAIERV